MKDDEKQALFDEFDRLYPNAGPELHFTNPYETLIATMLAAQCTDRQVNLVTPALFADYPDEAALAAASPEEIYPYVKSCGFKSKAERIVMACRMIMAEYGGSVPGDLGSLQKLPGVGRKTANVVYANAFGGDAIAVDTHVFRVSNRMGLANAKDVVKTEEQLMAFFPKRLWSVAHHWLILHGRRVCSAKKPACDACTLRPWCKQFNSNTL